MRKTSVLCVLIVLVMLAGGCEESQKAPTQWGQGDLPADWQATFGADNGSRMDFVQTRRINEFGKRIKALEDFCRIDKAECPFGLDEKACKAAPPHEH